MAFLVNEIFIVYKISHNGLHTVPSVWTSHALAVAAILYHKVSSHSGDIFQILTRQVNVALEEHNG